MNRPAPLAPGIGLTLYPVDRKADVLAIAAADIVTLHTHADPSDVALAARIRAINPRARIWLAIPANPLVRQGRLRALGTMRTTAQIAQEMGAECVEINGEGSSDTSVPGDWTPHTDGERRALEALAVDLVATTRASAPGLTVAWTSHDLPSFKLPWGAILGAVDLHSPQHYPAEKGRTVQLAELRSRVARSQGRWEMLAEGLAVPADTVPGGACWVPYGQGWGHSVDASCWLLDQAPLARLWACPGSWDANGTTALRAMRVIRDAAGHEPGAIARWQTARGLAADGIVGPKTLAALGLGA